MDLKKCSVCHGIINGNGADSEEEMFHRDCVKCARCKISLIGKNRVYSHDGLLYCDTSCVTNLPAALRCKICRLVLHGDDTVRKIQNTLFHSACIKCTVCKVQILTGESFQFNEWKFYCTSHYVTAKKTVHRTRINIKQRNILRKKFKKNKYPKADDLDEISWQTKLPKNVVKRWFQNARKKE